jgi:hypothetical protein
MKLSTANPVIINFDPFNAGVTQQQADLGSTFETSDYRRFRYALSGAALTAGNVGTEPAPKTNHMGVSPSVAAAVGQNSVSITLGATAATLGEYSEGWLVVSGTPGNGQTYKVSASPAVASSGTGTFTLYDNVSVALTTGSLVNLVHNPSNGAVEGTVQTRRSVGVPMSNVASGAYYWAQSRGYAAVAADAATAASLGSAMVLSGSVSGAVTASSSTFSAVIPVVAVNTLGGNAASKNSPMFLTID